MGARYKLPDAAHGIATSYPLCHFYILMRHHFACQRHPRATPHGLTQITSKGASYESAFYFRPRRHGKDHPLLPRDPRVSEKNTGRPRLPSCPRPGHLHGGVPTRQVLPRRRLHRRDGVRFLTPRLPRFSRAALAGRRCPFATGPADHPAPPSERTQRRAASDPPRCIATAFFGESDRLLPSARHVSRHRR